MSSDRRSRRKSGKLNVMYTRGEIFLRRAEWSQVLPAKTAVLRGYGYQRPLAVGTRDVFRGGSKDGNVKF